MLQVVEVGSTNLHQAIAFAATWATGDEASAIAHFDDHASGEGSSFIAVDDGVVVGLVTIRWTSNHEEFREHNIPLLHQIAVAEEHRGRGVATTLMDAAEDLVRKRGCQYIGITVGLFGEYGPAQRMYAKRGYVPDGRGVCVGKVPVSENDVVTVNHDLIMWLTKKLA